MKLSIIFIIAAIFSITARAESKDPSINTEDLIISALQSKELLQEKQNPKMKDAVLFDAWIAQGSVVLRYYIHGAPAFEVSVDNGTHDIRSRQLDSNSEICL